MFTVITLAPKRYTNARLKQSSPTRTNHKLGSSTVLVTFRKAQERNIGQHTSYASVQMETDLMKFKLTSLGRQNTGRSTVTLLAGKTETSRLRSLQTGKTGGLVMVCKS